MSIKARYRFLHNTKDISTCFETVECDEAGIRIMAEKAVFLSIELQHISLRAAIILKQEMMAIGGEVVLSREVMTLKPEKTKSIVLGTKKQYKKLIQKLYQQPFGCKEIADVLKYVVDQQEKQEGKWEWKGKTLDFSRPLIMGILNVTPDSFSDGGKYFDTQKAIAHAKNLIEEGADSIDVGGETTKPGSDPVSKEEEIKRVLPIVRALLQDKTITIPISIDTTKPEVARVCLEEGVHIINDVTGMRNPQMRKLAAQYNIPVIMMHMQGSPKTMQQNPQYTDVVDEIIDFFEAQIEVCKREGVTKIICDPGIGFGKTVAQNMEILKRLKEFSVLGVPIMVGTSRKSFIEKTVGGSVDDRLEGTLASNVIACMNGAGIFRVHDVKVCRRSLDLTAMILNGEKEK